MELTVPEAVRKGAELLYSRDTPDKTDVEFKVMTKDAFGESYQWLAGGDFNRPVLIMLLPAYLEKKAWQEACNRSKEESQTEVDEWEAGDMIEVADSDCGSTHGMDPRN